MQFKAGGEGGGEGKDFVKLKDRDSITGIFRGEVMEFRQHWGEQRSIVCSGDGCELCAKGNKPGFRFRLNFVVKENGQYVPKILEQGWTVYQTLKNLHESGFNLEQTVVKITRYGTGMKDTTYQIIPDPRAKFEGKLAQDIAAVELLPLAHDAKVPERAEAVSDANEDIPF